MSIVLAIDPGPDQCGWVLYEPQHGGGGILRSFGIHPIAHMLVLAITARKSGHFCACEFPQCYGKPVGTSVFLTCERAGYIRKAFGAEERHSYFYRSTIKLNLCNAVNAKDPHVRQVLLDRFGPDRKASIGTKKNPGPLYGVKDHVWAALALAVVWADLRGEP